MTSERDETRKRPFERWLRTGIWPAAADAANLECKSNPWHGERNGQFTFARTGRYVGQRGAARGAGGRSSSGAPGVAPPGRDPSKTAHAPGAPARDAAARPKKRSPGGDGWIGHGFTGGGGGRGGRGGGGGATGTAVWPDRQASPSTLAASAKPAPTIGRSATPAGTSSVQRGRVIVAIGYTYELETDDRVRGVSGEYHSLRYRSGRVRAR